METLIVGAVIGAIAAVIVVTRMNKAATDVTVLSPRARIVTLTALVALAAVATVIARLVSSGDMAAGLGLVAFAVAVAITTAAARALR